MRILYWDAFAGISGDMALGSLIALGADPGYLTSQLQSLGLKDFELVVSSREINGINATDVNVVVMGDHHSHRHLHDIEKMIKKSELSESAKNNSLKIFRILAEAEARVHGTTIDHVHFHEVGAVDSLVDIVGSAIALDQLEIDEIMVSILPWSRGFVHCAHGTLPVPAPATLEILEGFEFQDSGITGELITPTGAAIIKALAKQSAFPQMTLQKVGYGSGKNNYGIPSLLRGVIGEA